MTAKSSFLPSWLQRRKNPNTDSSDEADRIVGLYGDLLFDLCESVLWNNSAAQVTFRAIIQDLKRQYRDQPFRDHERSWVLRLACDRLKSSFERHARRSTSSEQIELDAIPDLEQRLGQFDAFFHRLTPDEQILLLLRDKYGIPIQEIAAALNVPEGSLKIRRQQALRTLETWLWSEI